MACVLKARKINLGIDKFTFYQKVNLRRVCLLAYSDICNNSRVSPKHCNLRVHNQSLMGHCVGCWGEVIINYKKGGIGKRQYMESYLTKKNHIRALKISGGIGGGQQRRGGIWGGRLYNFTTGKNLLT